MLGCSRELAVSPRSNGGSEDRSPSHAGLCRCCVHDPDCVYPRAGDRPVLFCDEFTPPETRPQVALPGRDGGSAGHEPLADVEEGSLLGLCRTCIHRMECLFPKSEGGVWHCGEFE